MIEYLRFFTLVGEANDYKLLIEVPVNKRGFPPHYINYNQQRCERIGNWSEGYYYQIWDKKIDDKMYKVVL